MAEKFTFIIGDWSLKVFTLFNEPRNCGNIFNEVGYKVLFGAEHAQEQIHRMLCLIFWKSSKYTTINDKFNLQIVPITFA